MKLEIKSSKIFEEKIKSLINKKKPLFGNNRSFSCIATKRKWARNKQPVTINGRKYVLSPGVFRSIRRKLGE